MKEDTSVHFSGRGELHGGARAITLVTLRKCTSSFKRLIKMIKCQSGNTFSRFRGGLAWIKYLKKDMVVALSYSSLNGACMLMIFGCQFGPISS